jgi:glycyl-tRNA synthetase (class II)
VKCAFPLVWARRSAAKRTGRRQLAGQADRCSFDLRQHINRAAQLKLDDGDDAEREALLERG